MEEGGENSPVAFSAFQTEGLFLFEGSSTRGSLAKTFLASSITAQEGVGCGMCET